MRSNSRVHGRAKALRRALSPPEALLWTRLRVRQPGEPRFRRQHPQGPYVLDFYCAPARLCIEVDGLDHWAGDRAARDEVRDSYLDSLGIRVTRYPAAEVLADPDGVAASIFEAARALMRRRKESYD